MKKLILLLAVLVPFFNTVSAQNSFSERVVFGLKAGGNLSNVYDTEGEQFEADSKLGFAGGAFLAIPIGNFLGIQPELLVSQRGFQATGSLFGTSYNFSRTTNYVDVPLLIALKPTEALTIVAGPQYSYLFNKRDTYSAGGISTAQETEFENENVRKNMLCFTGGLDINIQHIVIGGRIGFDLMQNNGDGTSSTPRYKNTWYQATIGYRF